MNLVRNRSPYSTDPIFANNLLPAGNVSPAFTSEAESGVLGAITNVNIAHNVSGDDGVFEQGGGIVLPKMMEVTIDFSPIHEHFLGWFDDGTFGNMAFPYGASQQASSEADYYLPNKASPTDEADSGMGDKDPDADAELPPTGDNSDEAQEEPSENQTSGQSLAMSFQESAAAVEGFEEVEDAWGLSERAVMFDNLNQADTAPLEDFGTMPGDSSEYEPDLGVKADGPLPSWPD